MPAPAPCFTPIWAQASHEWGSRKTSKISPLKDSTLEDVVACRRPASLLPLPHRRPALLTVTTGALCASRRPTPLRRHERQPWSGTSGSWEWLGVQCLLFFLSFMLSITATPLLAISTAASAPQQLSQGLGRVWRGGWPLGSLKREPLDQLPEIFQTAAARMEIAFPPQPGSPVDALTGLTDPARARRRLAPLVKSLADYVQREWSNPMAVKNLAPLLLSRTEMSLQSSHPLRMGCGLVSQCSFLPLRAG